MFRLVLLTLLAPATLVVAADWPTFRGEKRDNVSPDKGLLKEWPEGGPKLLWKGTGVGIGYSSVAVVGDRVYTMGSTGENGGGPAYLYALDRNKGGKPLWEAKVGASPGGGGFKGKRGAPTVDGELVYGLGPAGDLVCVEAATGKEKWRKDLPKDYKGSPGGWDYSESPLIDGDRLVCVPGGSKATLLVLDKKTGKEILQAPLPLKTPNPKKSQNAGYSSVVISSGGGVKQYVALVSAGTIGVDAGTGKLLWHYDKFADNTANIPTPIVLGDQIFTAAGYGKGTALLTLSKEGDGVKMKEGYSTAELTNKHGGLVIVGEYVYGDAGDGGNFTCAEWKTGKVKWKRGRSGKGSGSASVTYADGHLYVHYADGWASLVPASDEGYKEVGSFRIENSKASGRRPDSWAHPVVIDGCLYLREKDIVWCYDVKAK